MTHILTLETLISKGACADAQEKFARIFPNGAPLTVETFVNVAGEFNWHCAARLLLTPRNRVKFENAISTARDTYEATTDAAFATFYTEKSADRDAAYAAARDAYNASCDTREPARNAYNAAYAAYAARDDAYAARDAAFATAFATLYIHQESQTL